MKYSFPVRPRAIFIHYLFIIVFFTACSTEKNTLMTRSYHNLTSNYNIFFNGNESFKRGVEKAERNMSYNYLQILPVFDYSDESVARTVSSDMDRTLAKATKVITLHSITVKPEMKRGPVTQKQRDFYNKKEYNKWVDNNLLLMGKAYVYKREFHLALETFRRLITDFPGEPSRYEALIWMSRAYNELSEYRESERILNILETDRLLPKKLRGELYITYGDLHIKQDNFEKAFPYLENALKYTRKKKTKVRYTYILAQLYNETGNYSKANQMFREVIRLNPPYEMTFNARINMAATFRGGQDDGRNISTQLRKMLRDEKNKDFLDQVYYALGKLEIKLGNEDNAIEYFRRSISNSKTNYFQKGQSYLTLGDIFHDRKDYPLAQAYYDSSLMNLDTDYEKLYELERKITSLGALVENLKIYELEDSLQRLASLTEQQRIEIVDKIIAGLIQKEEEEKKMRSEEQMDTQYAYMLASQRMSGGNMAGEEGKWYFYNLNAKSFGQPEFRMLWGNRRLEDNWRRKNKQSVENFFESAETSKQEQAVAQPSMGLMNNKSRDFYLQNIPLNDSMLTVSHSRLAQALFNLGLIYKNDLGDHDKAVESFEELIKRYPGGKYTLDTYYNLYDLFNQLNQFTSSQTYKNLMVSEYPDSPAAMMLSNPDYIRELENERLKEYAFYNETYEAFNRAEYASVINNAGIALDSILNEDLLPRFMLLKALAVGGIKGREAMKEELEKLVADFPGHESGAYAREMIEFIYDASPEIKIADTRAQAEELYSVNRSAPHFVVISADKGFNINQLNFNVVNFNLDHYNQLNLSIQRESLGEKSLFIIGRFTDQAVGSRYMEVLKNDPGVFRELDMTKTGIFMISEANLSSLLNDKDLGKYLLFYEKYYEERLR